MQRILPFCSVVSLCCPEKRDKVGDNIIYYSSQRRSGGPESTQDLPKSTPLANTDHPVAALLLTISE